MISLTSLLAYLYGAEAGYGLARYIPVAIPTAATFFVLSVGTLWARPGRGLVAVVTADDQGGVLARRLLLGVIVVPALLGWLLVGHRELLSTELGLAIMVVVSVFLLTALIVATCQSLHRVDLIRKAPPSSPRRRPYWRRSPRFSRRSARTSIGAWRFTGPSILNTTCCQCAETWMAPSRTGQALAEQSSRMTFRRGVGLPGRIWSSGQSACIVDVVQDSNFPRAPSAATDGLRGAFGFPVVGPRGFLGVMEFFSAEIREPDDATLQSPATLSSFVRVFAGPASWRSCQSRVDGADSLAT